MTEPRRNRVPPIGRIVLVVIIAIVVGLLVCYGMLCLWDYLEDAGVIPKGL